ncbi:hypothetical protein B0H17DRAFT_543024 [Mycena rosella]|uniref:Uncharacterized protein n=1 Tax=Mycena rosella TaxID=1033263 RepID=A0AAD7BT37_MYCRO|nr:hypothetical protein B0H17DRAFT_543024 [Mycena rosella]
MSSSGTFFFGAYTVIIFLSTRMLIRRGLKARVHWILLVITLFMYLLSTAYWTYRFADVINRIQIYIESPQNPPSSSSVTKWLPLFNALVLVNYVLSDGVVLWRARLISSPDHHKVMYLPLFFMVLASLSSAGVIGLRIASVSSFAIGESPAFIKTLNTLQVAGLGLSFISNVCATGVVGATAWVHRRTIRAGSYKTTQGNRILGLLLESGVLYCVFGLLGVVSILIRLPYNTLGDLVGPINVQVAGAYTPIVLLLVSMQRSLSDTSLLGTIPDAAISTPFQYSVSNPASVRPAFSVQLATRDENTDAEAYPEVGRFKENQHEKGHQYQVSDAILV